ncbi:hypothetical protein [Rhodoferax aquaticus]|uniref:Uncharacterized protein n=1 Tax=Rhodoferax aquaticus TaxID=2527691 RepID=A0A515EPE3_9BURK|nr:hypothetical protein [Rhodoferax aquaticus]QDL54538.1 hypothetical protein EXZ61_10380 [Rhodoferax aquaticus]
MHKPSHQDLDLGVAIYDQRTFFEKALQFGMAHGIISQEKLDAICVDAPKGMVQIARYFGNENLRPDIELARHRIVNLVSLCLEHSSGGNLARAAQSLQDHSFMSRSKTASDMLKALIAMPQNTHFGMHDSAGFQDEHIPILAKWSLRPLADYQAELLARSQIANTVGAATWFAQELGLEQTDLEEAGTDAEAVIRTGLLALALRRSEMPDWPMFEKMVGALRKSFANEPDMVSVPLPKGLPSEYKEVVERVKDSVLEDMPRILDAQVLPRKLFDQTAGFVGRYFWIEDLQAEVEHIERQISKTWDKAAGGHSDESSLLTLFLSIAAGSPQRTLLTEKTATTLVRKLRKSGLNHQAARDFIQEHAPIHACADYVSLWDNFIEEAEAVLLSDFDYQLHDALALLRRECNVASK